MKLIISEDKTIGTVREYELHESCTSESVSNGLAYIKTDANYVTIRKKDGDMLVIGIDVIRNSIIEFKQ